MQNFLQDVHFALRQFRRRPGFTLTAILILALGLGANTAIFSIVDAFLLRPLPFRDPGRLTALYERNVIGEEPYNRVGPGTFLQWQQVSKSFEQMAAWTINPVNLATPGRSFHPQRVDGCACSWNLFSTLGVNPALGRAFRADEDRYGASPVAVIGYGLWQRRFGGSPQIIGRQIRLDGVNAQIVGVMPRGFAFPSRTVQVWQPLLQSIPPAIQERHDTHFLQVVGRLRPGISVASARSEVDGIAARYKRDHPDTITGHGANVVPLHASLVRDVRTSLLVLLAAVCCVLLIACMNVANLLLTRASGRAREVSIRAAIGASRARIVRQLLTESILLSLAGAVAGLIAAAFIIQFLAAHAPGADAILPAGAASLDFPVFLFAFAIALLSGVAAGIFPAIQSSRADLAGGLRETSRSSTAGRAHARLRTTLVTAEVGISLVLLVCAGLLLRSFMRLAAVNPGVRVDHTLTFRLSLPDVHYSDHAKMSAFAEQLSARLSSIPGVVNAGLVSCAPVTGHCNDWVFSIVGHPLPAGQVMDALTRSADSAYFAAAGIPLLRGRVFLPQDGIGFDDKHPRLGSALISESAAKEFFANENPLGKQVRFGTDAQRRAAAGNPIPYYQIVGVVGDVLTELDAQPEPTIYLPLLDGGSESLHAILHTSADPRSVIAAARREIDSMDPDLAIYEVGTMEDILGQSSGDRRFSMLLLAAFAGLALVLAATGLYGLLSYGVSQRSSEIGVRMALGARSSDVSGLIMREGLKPAIVGVVLGLGAAFLVSRVLRSLLFGVDAMDPLTFAVVPLLLLFVAAVACYVPAARAARIDPTITLRMD
jgi:predicted permease